MNRYVEQPLERSRRSSARTHRQVGSVDNDPGWTEAERAAAELSRALDAMGEAADFVGLRVVRNVVGRPVVQLGTVEADVARGLAGLIRVATPADALSPARYPGP